MTWYYKGEEFKGPPEDDYAGFVYLITNTQTDIKYIGQKIFWTKRRYKTKPKIRKVQSDWKKYFGSSKALKKDLQELGEDFFRKEILHMCKTKGDMTYIELYEQIKRRVLFRNDYYNNFIGCKIHSKHLTKDLNINE